MSSDASTSSPSRRRKAASTAVKRAADERHRRRHLPGRGDRRVHQLGVEVEEGGDDHVGRHRAHGRRPRREVARPSRDTEPGIGLGRLGHEVDHAVQRLQGPPRLARQQTRAAVSSPSSVVHKPSSAASRSASRRVAATMGRRLEASRTTRSLPSAFALGHTDLAADEQPRQVVPAVEGAGPDHEVGVQHALGDRAALERGRAEGPVLRPARVQAGEARDPHNGGSEVLAPGRGDGAPVLLRPAAAHGGVALRRWPGW